MKAYTIITKTAAILFIMAGSFFNLSSLKAENPEWKYYPQFMGVQAFAENNEYIWVCTDFEKIFKFHKPTETIVDSIIYKGTFYGSILDTDSKGNLWIVSYSGLSKYDGKNLTTWDKENFNNIGLPATRIMTMNIDKEDNLWFGFFSVTGLYKFDGVNKAVKYSENAGFPIKSTTIISCIEFDSKNNLWIAFSEGGIAKYENSKWEFYNTENSPLPGEYVSNMKFDSKDNLWVRADYKLVKIHNNNWTVYDSSNSDLSLKYIYKMAIDKSDNIWFSTNKFGDIYKFDGNTVTNFNPLNSGIKDGLVTSVFVDSQNNKWFGYNSESNFKGMNVYREGGINFEPVSVSEGNNNSISIKPNPVDDYIEININSEELQFFASKVQVQVFDLLGIEALREVIQPTNSSHRINVSHLPSGLYIIKYSHDGVNLITQTFIKN